MGVVNGSKLYQQTNIFLCPAALNAGSTETDPYTNMDLHVCSWIRQQLLK